MEGMFSAYTLVLVLALNGGAPYDVKKPFQTLGQCEAGKVSFEKLIASIPHRRFVKEGKHYKLLSATCVPVPPPLRIAPALKDRASP